jgi:hypothetical protein
MEPLPCPLCKGALEPSRGRHGLVWVCRVCRAGAVTLPTLRQVAARPFVNQLWQAALHHGCASKVVCPACTQPFTEFRRASGAAHPPLKVCVRCFWVWLSPEGLSSVFTVPTLPPMLGLDRAVVQGTARGEPAAADEARRVLGSLAAGVLRRVL